MVVKEVTATNARSISNQLESAIRKSCVNFSHLSIVERLLRDLCVSHFNYLSLLTGDRLLRMKEEARAEIAIRLPSMMLTPHYLACFSELCSTSSKPIDEIEYKKLR